MQRIIVGFIGDIGSGKTTAANYLERTCKFTSYAFADPLKKIGYIFGFTKEQLYGTQQEKMVINPWHGISGREFMEKFGTDVCREALPKIIPNMPNIWVKLFKIFATEYPRDHIVVSDVRFPDEANEIVKQGGFLIKIIRPNVDKKNLREESKSEQAKNDITEHITIINDGDFEEFYKNIRKAIDSLFTKKFGESFFRLVILPLPY